MVQQGPEKDDRPDFLVTLGLLPPFTVEDAALAYREKAKLAHPDRGGSVEHFLKLKAAYEHATEYANLHAGRREWLAAQVERYAKQEEVILEVRRRGGQVETETVDWVKRSVGNDFALLTEMLRGIRLRGAADGDDFLHYLAAHQGSLRYLLWLDLADSRISDEGLLQLPRLELLKRLNLAGTPTSQRGLQVLERLPRLEWLNLAGTPVRWFTRWRLHSAHPRLQLVTTPEP
jgi:hypothetical protein